MEHPPDGSWGAVRRMLGGDVFGSDCLCPDVRLPVFLAAEAATALDADGLRVPQHRHADTGAGPWTDDATGDNRAYEAIQRFSGEPERDATEVTIDSLSQARSNLFHTVHPSASTLVAYYDTMVRLYPDRNTLDSADLYQEYMKILLTAYSKAQQFTTSWWQMKAVLEHYFYRIARENI